MGSETTSTFIRVVRGSIATLSGSDWHAESQVNRAIEVEGDTRQ